MSDIEKLLKALVTSDVKFIVVGAYAAILQGSSLRTDDLDICYERTPDNCRRIFYAIAPFRPRLRDSPANLKAPFDERSLAQGTNFTLGTDLGNLDLLGELSGVGGYRDIIANAEVLEFGDLVFHVASLEQSSGPRKQPTGPRIAPHYLN